MGPVPTSTSRVTTTADRRVDRASEPSLHRGHAERTHRRLSADLHQRSRPTTGARTKRPPRAMTRNTPVKSPFLSPGTKGLGLPAGGDVQEGAYLLPSRLYRRLRRLFQRAPARCRGLAVPPQGNALDRPRLYAIGDVHGRADLLERLLSAIEADAKKAGVPPSVEFLGDIVDRGPDSRGLPRSRPRHAGTLAGLAPSPRQPRRLSFVLLRRSEPQGPLVRVWLDQGGRETLLSYGLDADDPKAARRAPARAPRRPLRSPACGVDDRDRRGFRLRPCRRRSRTAVVGADPPGTASPSGGAS